jgi:hypothetical protein
MAKKSTLKQKQKQSQKVVVNINTESKPRRRYHRKPKPPTDKPSQPPQMVIHQNAYSPMPTFQGVIPLQGTPISQSVHESLQQAQPQAPTRNDIERSPPPAREPTPPPRENAPAFFQPETRENTPSAEETPIRRRRSAAQATNDTLLETLRKQAMQPAPAPFVKPVELTEDHLPSFEIKPIRAGNVYYLEDLEYLKNHPHPKKSDHHEKPAPKYTDRKKLGGSIMPKTNEELRKLRIYRNEMFPPEPVEPPPTSGIAKVVKEQGSARVAPSKEAMDSEPGGYTPSPPTSSGIDPFHHAVFRTPKTETELSHQLRLHPDEQEREERWRMQQDEHRISPFIQDETGVMSRNPRFGLSDLNKPLGRSVDRKTGFFDDVLPQEEMDMTFRRVLLPLTPSEVEQKETKLEADEVGNPGVPQPQAEMKKTPLKPRTRARAKEAELKPKEPVPEVKPSPIKSPTSSMIKFERLQDVLTKMKKPEVKDEMRRVGLKPNYVKGEKTKPQMIDELLRLHKTRPEVFSVHIS